MSFGWQTRAVAITGTGHPQLQRVLIHDLGESFLGAGEIFSQRDAGIVAGLHDHALEQLLDSDPGIDLNEHACGRAFSTPFR